MYYGNNEWKFGISRQYDGSIAVGLFGECFELFYDNSIIFCYLGKICNRRTI